MDRRKEVQDTRVRVKIINIGKAKQGLGDWVERKGVLFPSSLFSHYFLSRGQMHWVLVLCNE